MHRGGVHLLNDRLNTQPAEITGVRTSRFLEKLGFLSILSRVPVPSKRGMWPRAEIRDQPRGPFERDPMGDGGEKREEDREARRVRIREFAPRRETFHGAKIL